MDNSQTSQTREEYLLQSINILRDKLFAPKGYQVPTVKVSVGFPKGGKKAIGQHWSPHASIDNLGSVFISPVLDDTLEVLAVLVHELVHAAVGNEHKHGKVFKQCALTVGLEGKMTATTATEWLKTWLKTNVVGAIGEYPHARLNLNAGPIKKQTTRMIKMECSACGYIARASRQKIDEHGPVICPCNGERMGVSK